MAVQGRGGPLWSPRCRTSSGGRFRVEAGRGGTPPRCGARARSGGGCGGGGACRGEKLRRLQSCPKGDWVVDEDPAQPQRQGSNRGGGSGALLSPGTGAGWWRRTRVRDVSTCAARPGHGPIRSCAGTPRQGAQPRSAIGSALGRCPESRFRTSAGSTGIFFRQNCALGRAETARVHPATVTWHSRAGFRGGRDSDSTAVENAAGISGRRTRCNGAFMAIASGLHETVLVVGAEKAKKKQKKTTFTFPTGQRFVRRPTGRAGTWEGGRREDVRGQAPGSGTNRTRSDGWDGDALDRPPVDGRNTASPREGLATVARRLPPKRRRPTRRPPQQRAPRGCRDILDDRGVTVPPITPG